MAGQPTQAQVAQAVTTHFAEFHYNGQRIGRFNALNAFQNTLARRLNLLIGNGVIGVFEVGGIYRVTIAPGHAITQFEGPGQAIFRHFPAFGHRTIRCKFTAKGVLTNQAREEHGIDGATGRLRRENRIEQFGVGNASAAPDAARLGFGRGGIATGCFCCGLFGRRSYGAGINRRWLHTARQNERPRNHWT